MAQQVKYKDRDGREQVGWEDGGHVYQDEALSKPIGVGSTYTGADGRTWKMTDYGGRLWSTPNQYDSSGIWTPQGNQWYVAAQDVLDKINNPKFDLNGNALYQQMKDKYVRLGQQAMEHTMGQAAGLTGGYGSSYGQNVGQQAYNAYLTQLNDAVPDLIAQERQDLYDRYTALAQMYGQNYQENQDRINEAYTRWAQNGRADDRVNALLGQGSGRSSGGGTQIIYNADGTISSPNGRVFVAGGDNLPADMVAAMGAAGYTPRPAAGPDAATLSQIKYSIRQALISGNDSAAERIYREYEKYLGDWTPSQP